MPIPNEIPVGARIVVRTLEGVDPTDHRMKFRDYVGHVRSWDGQKLEMTRDAAANGSRPEQRVTIPADEIVTIKPVPERSMTRPRPYSHASPYRAQRQERRNRTDFSAIAALLHSDGVSRQTTERACAIAVRSPSNRTICSPLRADSSSVRCQSFSGIDSSTVAQCSAYSGCLLAAL